MVEAAQVIRWFAESLASFAEDAADSRLVRAANWAAGRLKEWATEVRRQGSPVVLSGQLRRW